MGASRNYQILSVSIIFFVFTFCEGIAVRSFPCTGTPDGCGTFTDQNNPSLCYTQLGCVLRAFGPGWTNETDQICVGRPIPCSSFTNQFSCPAQSGCSWTTSTTSTTSPTIPLCSSGSQPCITSINIYPGWNMFSFPIITTATVGNDNLVTTDCTPVGNIWHYNPSQGQYVQILSSNQNIQGSGMWIKVNVPCTINVTVTNNKLSISNFPNISPGWNQIGSPTQSTTFSPGNCNVLSGPWKYNTQTGQYEKAQTLVAGTGYWIKVSSSCSL